MFRGIMTVGLWTMASRVLGFARDMLFAAYLGTGNVADAFFVAQKLPNLFRRLFGEGAFNAAFVPDFSKILTREGPEAAHRFAEEAFAVLGFWLLAITVAGEIFMPAMMRVLAPGPGFTGAKLAVTITLSRIAFPYLLFICLAALLSGVLNGLHKFWAAAAAPVVYNIISIAFMLGLTRYVPTVGHAFAWGISVAGVAQLALLMWAVKRAGMAIHVPRPRLSPKVRMLMVGMLPGLASAGATQINQLVDVAVSSFLPSGTVSLLYYANQLNQLPLAVIGTAVGTALLPLLSRQVNLGEDDKAVHTMNRALEYALLLALPAALALMTAGLPIITVLFGRGRFDHTSAVKTAECLACYSLGLPSFVMIKVLQPGFYARGDRATPMKIAIGAVLFNLAMNLAFMVPLQYMGPALASGIAGIANAGAMGFILHRRGLIKPDAQLLARAPKICVASLLMAAVLWFGRGTLFTPFNHHGFERWLGLMVLVGAGVIVYFGSAILMGVVKVGPAVRRIRRA